MTNRLVKRLCGWGGMLSLVALGAMGEEPTTNAAALQAQLSVLRGRMEILQKRLQESPALLDAERDMWRAREQHEARVRDGWASSPEGLAVRKRMAELETERAALDERVRSGRRDVDADPAVAELRSAHEAARAAEAQARRALEDLVRQKASARSDLADAQRSLDRVARELGALARQSRESAYKFAVTPELYAAEQALARAEKAMEAAIAEAVAADPAGSTWLRDLEQLRPAIEAAERVVAERRPVVEKLQPVMDKLNRWTLAKQAIADAEAAYRRAVAESVAQDPEAKPLLKVLSDAAGPDAAARKDAERKLGEINRRHEAGEAARRAWNVVEQVQRAERLARDEYEQLLERTLQADDVMGKSYAGLKEMRPRLADAEAGLRDLRSRVEQRDRIGELRRDVESKRKALAEAQSRHREKLARQVASDAEGKSIQAEIKSIEERLNRPPASAR